MVGTIPRGLVIIIDHDRSRENEELMFEFGSGFLEDDVLTQLITLMFYVIFWLSRTVYL